MTTAAPTVNPAWRAAIDAAMHESIMNRDPLPLPSTNEQAPPSPPPPPPAPPVPLPPRRFEPDLESADESIEMTPPQKPTTIARPAPFAPFKIKRPHRSSRKSSRRSPPRRRPPTPEPESEEEEEEFEEEIEEEDEDEDNFAFEGGSAGDDDGDGSVGDAHASARIQENARLAEEEKMDLLARLNALTDEGAYKPVRVYCMGDRLEDIRYETFRAEREVARKRSVRGMQKNLVTASLGMEILNNHMGFGLNLAGFSKSVLLSIGDYTDVLNELHFIYKDSFRMRPEVRLAWMMASSAYLYHMAASTQTPMPTPMPMPTQTPQPQAQAHAQPSMGGPSQNVQGLAMLTQLLR
jgi:hypothetical protein